MKTEFKGTQGEWEVIYEKVECDGVVLHIPNTEIGIDESVANAKLIASAPDLLNNFISAIILLKQTNEFEVLESYRIKVLEFEKVLEKALT